MLFKLSCVNSNLTLTQGYQLRPGLAVKIADKSMSSVRNLGAELQTPLSWGVMRQLYSQAQCWAQLGDVNLANCSVISHYGSWPLHFWNFLTERMSIDQYGCLAGLYTFFRPYHLMHTALIWEFCHIVFQQNCAQDHTNSKLFSTTLKFQKKKKV